MSRPRVGHRRPCRSRRSIGLVGAVLILAILLPRAAAATNADAFYAVDQIAAKTQLPHEANFSDAMVENVHRPQALHPRHVLQMERPAQQKANSLAWLNGVETIAVGPTPTRKAGPADVLASIDAAAWVIGGVMPIVGVKEQIEPAARREDVTSSDIYSTLLQLSEPADDLGRLIALTPTHVANRLQDTSRLVAPLTRRAQR